jgi:lysophospholipid acyltransferase (LPLAT)-like uncharacterized protein
LMLLSSWDRTISPNPFVSKSCIPFFGGKGYK